MSVTTYPNGQQLVSSALLLTDVNKLMQQLTCGMLGIAPVDPALVRVDWQTQGQPFNDVTQDICYVSCVLEDDNYTKVRNLTTQQNSPSDITVRETWTYTRAWRVDWVLYGPNSLDRARMIQTAVLFVDYFTDQLNLSNLFPLSDPPQPVRMPEKINAQWFERVDFNVRMYENVTDTIQVNVVESVENLVYTKDGLQDDFTVTRS